MKGELYIVSTPIGNMGEISSRAIEILEKVDLIMAEDTRKSVVLLNHFKIKTKMQSYHKFNEMERVESVITKLIEGKNIALISDAGTPCISDPGYILVDNAIQNGIKVIGISGPCAAITALSVSGFNCEAFSFYGFLPRKSGKMSKQLSKIKQDLSDIVIFYESPKRIIKTLIALKDEFPKALICLCNDLTKKYERIYRGDLEQVIGELNDNVYGEKGEYTIIIKKNMLQLDENIDYNISIEAMLVDIMIKNEVSLKEAMDKLRMEFSESYSRKDIYNASLKLKNLL